MHWTQPVARLALVGLLAFAPPAFAADTTSDTLSVSGAVRSPLVLDVDALKSFPPDQVASVTVNRHVGETDVPSTVRGVKLTAVLERAGLADTGHNDWKRAVVLATATDGYRVAFSWPELFNTEVGAGVLVVFERDGRPLADREGRIALVSARDVKSGPRSVRSLTRLTVSLLAE